MVYYIEFPVRRRGFPNETNCFPTVPLKRSDRVQAAGVSCQQLTTKSEKRRQLTRLCFAYCGKGRRRAEPDGSGMHARP